MTPRKHSLTGAQMTVAVIVGVLSMALAGLAFTGMFTAVRTEMVPFLGPIAWIVPVGVDMGVLALIAGGILLEWLAMPMPTLRYVAMVFMGASVWLNIAAAHGNTTGAVGHAALPVLFIACIEAVRHAVRHTAGMAAGTVRDGIPAARWILAPWPTFLMFRRMVLQRIYSFPDASALEISRRNALEQLRACHGPQWKRMAPADLVWMLRKGVSVPDAVKRVAEMTGSPVPGTGRDHGLAAGGDRGGYRERRNPERRAVTCETRPGSAPGSAPAATLARPAAAFRSESDLEEQALAIVLAHKAVTGERMNAKDFRRALGVKYNRSLTIRAEIRDREDGVA